MHVAKPALLALALLASGSPAFAATDTTTFQVTMTITEACAFGTIGASNVNFGSHARSTGSDAQGELVVNCSAGTPYAIGLNDGGNSTSATVSATNRRMANGTNFVPYGLYQDVGRSTLWGNIAGTTLAGTGTGANTTIPVYGRVLATSTNVPAGTYVDTVTATITY